MQIETGRGKIPLLTLLSILSISLVTSLPGLAISPIMGDLDKIFPQVSDFEIQMLSSLPSLLIIPFVLLSGKLSEKKDKSILLIIGLIIYLICGILFFFTSSMTGLIIISCLLGIGAGIVIPLSTGLLASFFVGKYRTQQLGIKSGITNLALVLATFLTGWLATFNWHLPFIVYLMPIIPLLLSYFLSKKVLQKNHVYAIGETAEELSKIQESPFLKKGEGLRKPLLGGIMGIYFLMTLYVLSISFNLPFVIQEYHFSSSYTGTLTAVFFLSIMLPGFFLNTFLKHLGKAAVAWSFAGICIGLFIILASSSLVLLFIAMILCGGGYGILQPLIYDKATLCARHDKSVLALAFVMAVNYLAIFVYPFILDASITFFQPLNKSFFPFIFNGILSAATCICAFIFYRSFLFSQNGTIVNNN